MGYKLLLLSGAGLDLIGNIIIACAAAKYLFS